MTRRFLTRTDLLSASTGVALAIVSAVALYTPASAATSTTADGSDWGPQGTLSSDSSVTVRWDNTGNPAADDVERNSLQSLPHTANKTYASIPSDVRNAYNKAFGPDNGVGGLQVTVSQTRGLLNQAVTVTATGGTGGNLAGNGDYLQIFQCWGTATETSPDPADCQVGAQSPDITLPNFEAFGGRRLGPDQLLTGGDWAQYQTSAYGNDNVAPFTAVDGSTVSGDPQKNPLFNSATSNEWEDAGFDAQGRVVRQFEMQTGAESTGLGCGYRSDAPSTSTCWLVIVPRLRSLGQTNMMGPLAPQVWGQRLQIQLGFRDVFTSCSGGQARLLNTGSEALSAAAASWTPGACAATGITLGYTETGDEVARNQYAAGASDSILTTRPLPATTASDTAYVPLSLTAPVLSYTLDYVPVCDGPGLDIKAIADESGDQGESDAKSCGYDSLAALQADYAKTGTQVTDLRLDARLVVKLLTQFYGQGLGLNFSGILDAVAPKHPADLIHDPEFQALNPELKHMFGRPGYPLGRALVELPRSDEAAALWAWALQDEGAASFLAGCPDPYDRTINPFYSTRTYDGCQYRAKALDKAAAAQRAQVTSPDAFVDAPPTYPPDGSPYPLPDYYERPANYSTPTGVINYGPLTFAEAFPVYNNAAGSGRQAAWYDYPNVGWCSYAADITCVPSPGTWKIANTRTTPGDRAVIAVTDAATAAKYQTPTALLCDDDSGDGGEDCVGANTASLQKAATLFTIDKVSGTRQPPADVSGFYAAGAYPLTLPVYAAVRTSQPVADRAAYATAFDYVTTSGQTQGLDAGNLPPGYAPLTPALQRLAAKGIAAIRAGVPTAPEGDGTPPTTPSGGPTPTSPDMPTTSTTSPASTGPGPGSDNPGGPQAPGASTAPSGPGAVPTGSTPSGTTDVATPGALMPAAAGTETWPRYTLPLGLAIALLSGVVGPLLRTRTRWRIR